MTCLGSLVVELELSPGFSGHRQASSQFYHSRHSPVGSSDHCSLISSSLSLVPIKDQVPTVLITVSTALNLISRDLMTDRRPTLRLDLAYMSSLIHGRREIFPADLVTLSCHQPLYSRSCLDFHATKFSISSSQSKQSEKS